jgi:hypothetical protein
MSHTAPYLQVTRVSSVHTPRVAHSFILLQVNLSHNRLSGGVPGHMAILAAVRPVMVTMKDG